MTHADFEPATRRMAELIRGIPDEALDRPTPCPDYSLGDLLDHVGGLARAFTSAATKDLGGSVGQAPSGDASRLVDDWRTRIPRDLATLAEAWRAPEAWTGMTQAGGVDLPGEVAGLVALDEVVIHGWDVARASGQAYDCDEAALAAVHRFVRESTADGESDGVFGPVVPVAEDAPLLDRVLGLTGRDPAWPAASGQPPNFQRTDQPSTTTEGETMPMNLNNIMLGSEDSKQLADFYSQVLGAPNPDWSDEGSGWFGFKAGDGSLAIGPHSEVKGRNPEPARVMLNFSTSDVKGEFDRIKALGAEVIAEPYEPMGGSGMMMCTFADPDGNYFQLAPPWESMSESPSDSTPA